MSMAEEEIRALYERYPIDEDVINVAIKKHGTCIRLITHEDYVEWIFNDGYRLKISSED